MSTVSDTPIAPAAEHPKDRPAFPAAEYAAAIEEERQNRDFAFLGIPHDLCGIEVVDMTLRQLLVRMNIGCPIINGEAPGPEDIASFLWHLSPHFAAAGHGEARADFVRKLAAIPYDEMRDAIAGYLDYTFLDAPGGSAGNRIARTSIAATLIDIMGDSYGWTDEKTLDTALVRIYQLIREILQRKNPKALLSNRKSDRVMTAFTRALHKHAKERKAAANTAFQRPDPTEGSAQ